MSILRRIHDYHEQPPEIDEDHDRLEANIAKLARQAIRNDGYDDRLPALEQPMVTSEDLGRITAEAVKTSYEATAQAIAQLGIEAAKRVDEITQLKIKQEELSRACLDLAEQYRAEGNKQSETIAEAAQHLAACADWIADMRKKLKGEA